MTESTKNISFLGCNAVQFRKEKPRSCAFSKLLSITTQNPVLFVVTVVRTSNPVR
jgi:hypothetical protein